MQFGQEEVDTQEKFCALDDSERLSDHNAYQPLALCKENECLMNGF